MQIHSVGIDLGKTTFHLVALGAASKLLASEREERGPACVGEIAEVADADETSGQHMLAEAAQELARG